METFKSRMMEQKEIDYLKAIILPFQRYVFIPPTDPIYIEFLNNSDDIYLIDIKKITKPEINPQP